MALAFYLGCEGKQERGVSSFINLIYVKAMCDSLRNGFLPKD